MNERWEQNIWSEKHLKGRQKESRGNLEKKPQRRIKKTFRERQEDKSGKKGGAEGEIFKKRQKLREDELRGGRVKESPAET